MTKPIKHTLLIFIIFLTVGCSSFHVRVIDQNGKPVPDVKVRVGTLTNLFLVSGSKTEFYITDDDGRFNLGGPRVGIELIHKNGYEFMGGKGFGSTTTYSNFKKGQENSYSNPYYILAWKRDEPEILIGKENAKEFTLHSNNQYFPFIFTNKGVYRNKRLKLNSHKIENSNLLLRYKELDEVVLNRFNQKRHKWMLTLTVPNGGLINTNDIIRNLAPKDGYKRKWTIKSDDLTDVDSNVIEKFYLKSHNGKVYGQFILNFAPKFRAVSFKPYWLNPNGSRNLTRSKKYIYCKPRNFVPEDCSVNDFGP